LFFLAALICGLLTLNYLSQRSLQRLHTQHLQQSLIGHAANISYFFSERENDIHELATSTSVTGFFSNQALGMSMAYGLRASLNEIGRIFEQKATTARIQKTKIYSHLLLLDTDGLVLSKWPSSDIYKHAPEIEKAAFDATKTIIVSYTDGLVSITCPVLMNNQLKGYIQGWMSYKTILHDLFGAHKHEGIFIVTDHERQVFQSQPEPVFPANIFRTPHRADSKWPRQITENDLLTPAETTQKAGHHLTLFYSSIPGYEISLFLAESSDSILSRKQNLYLFMIMLFVVSAAILLIATIIFRAGMRNIILETSLLEAAKKEHAIAEKIEELELIINGARLGTWSWHIPSGKVLFNERWAKMLGYTLDELAPNVTTWKELVHPDDLDRIMQELQLHLEGKTAVYFAVHRLRHKSGKWIWVHDTGKVLKRDQTGKPLQALGIHLDITELKEAQQLLGQAKEASDTIIRNFLDTLIVVHNDLTLARVNQATCQLLGYTEKELIGKPITLLFHEPAEQVNSIFSFYEQAQADMFNNTAELRNIELCYRAKDGSRLPMSINISLLKDDNGVVTGVVAGAKDISKLKEAINRIARQKEYIENLFDVVPEGLLALAPSMQIIERNRAFNTITRTWSTLFNLPEQEISKEIQEKIQISLTNNKQSTFSLTHNNNTAYLKYNTTPVPALEEIEYVVSLSDITSERKTEAARRLLATVIEQTADSVIITETDGTILYVNPATTIHSGFSESELNGKKTNIFKSGLTNPAVYKELWESITKGNNWSGLLSNRKKDGSVIEEDVTISPVRDDEGKLTHFVAIKRDMTEMNLLHRQLLQAQKLEAIGQLAAGIAHEINTPMQYVQNNVTFIGRAFRDLSLLLNDYLQLQNVPELSLTEEARHHLENINLDFLMEEIPESIEEAQDGINRVVRIISAMKDFSHPGTGKKVATDLNRALDSTITVARNEWKYVAEMVTDFDPDLPMVSCLPDQLNQVMLNLIINSAHAIEETGASAPDNAGRITISTRQDNNWIEIRVSDTGPGIPDEIRNQIFDPFFTTKMVGKGTGQGLAIAHDVVVNKHGGIIDFITEPGKGTTFIIRLPLTIKINEVTT
jgi:PAS domain S-box-containing protein